MKKSGESEDGTLIKNKSTGQKSEEESAKPFQLRNPGGKRKDILNNVRNPLTNRQPTKKT